MEENTRSIVTVGIIRMDHSESTIALIQSTNPSVEQITVGKSKMVGNPVFH